MDEKLFYILAADLAMRAKYYSERKDYDAAVAYDNAFDMLAYAINGNWECLRQFGWSDEAEELINKVGIDIDLWDLEELIKQNATEEWACTPEAVAKVCGV